MDEPSIDDTEAADQEPDSGYFHGGVSPDGMDRKELENTMDVLMRLDMDLAFSFKKLLNLSRFLMHVLGGIKDKGFAMKNCFILLDSFERTLAFDYLSAIIDFEVRELQGVMDTLQTEVLHTQLKISSDVFLTELYGVAEEKLNDCKVYLKQSQENVSKMKMQSDKMQRALMASQHENRRNEKFMECSENGELSRADPDFNMQIGGQRDTLWMLAESLSRELDLEKKISEFEQNEEELQLKLHLTKQVASCMEEASEVVWGRFLEAENTAEVLMGISKELLGELETSQSNLNSLIQREDELNLRINDCIEQLKANKNDMSKLESSNADLSANLNLLQEERDCTEEFNLSNKVKALEEQLNVSNLQLKSANASKKSLKEGISEAESRAASAEARVSVLVEANMELTEELGFLKGGENNAKVGLLEKKLRELEIQSRQAQASSEASQKQQSMLYSAILDMETLISDLKSKLSVAESKAEAAEEQCNTLSNANLKLNDENRCLKARIGSLEMSNDEKVARARDINVKTKLLKDMVKQLTFEREFIQTKLYSVMKENSYLVESLNEAKKGGGSQITHSNREHEREEFVFSRQDSTTNKKSSTEISKAGD